MSVTINISIPKNYLKKFDLIVEHEWSDRSKLIRKWIDQNFKEEYNNKKPV